MRKKLIGILLILLAALVIVQDYFIKWEISIWMLAWVVLLAILSLSSLLKRHFGLGFAYGIVALSTLGAYVLIQWDMPGRTFFANFLLFTMIFNGGMIPTYLVMKNLGLTNNLLGVVLLPAINIYNLVLMRNFFEGIPQSLFEAATLDGCTPMATFIKVVLPLSKAALASIGLMFAVAYWNDYTNYKLYITDSTLYNFQMKLRSIMMGSDLPQANGGATENTVKSAAIIIAILPFMILYPFLQKYFVKGVNVGAVKG